MGSGFPTAGLQQEPSGVPGLADPAFGNWSGAEPATAPLRPYPRAPAGG